MPYRSVVRPLTDEEGGGYLVEFPDLPGCLPDAKPASHPAVGSGPGSDLRDVRATLRELAPVLRSRWGVRVVGVFGSVARGDGGPTSDVDLLVQLERPLGLAFVDLVEFLEGKLGRRVDLLSRDFVRPRLWREIEAEVVPV